MDSMFHDDGSPNLTNNTKDKNGEIETLAAELKSANKALDENASSDAKTDVQYIIKEIQRYYDRYANANLSGYTAESAAALRTALTQAKKLVDEFVSPIWAPRLHSARSSPADAAQGRLRAGDGFSG